MKIIQGVIEVGEVILTDGGYYGDKWKYYRINLIENKTIGLIPISIEEYENNKKEKI